MKYVPASIIVLLAAAVIYTQVSNGRRVAALERRIGELEGANQTMRNDYETRIARLRAQAARQPGDGGLPRSNPLLDAIGQKINPEQRENPFDKFRADVKLDEAQDQQARTILDEYAKARTEILGRAQAEKRFMFDATSLDAINQARRVGLERLRSVLSDEQYARMLHESHDEKLGLRVAPPARN